MRKPIIAGNWKMNMISGEAKDLANGIKNEDSLARSGRRM